MDCGPATLKCLLEGFGISVSYSRLREACQTDVDGTSIDTMEDVAVQLGLDAEQVMIPADHLLLPVSRSLPCIAVVRLPGGLTHFVVVWHLHGRFVQIMDPGKGRLWLTQKRFLNDLYIHTHPVATDLWREWAGSDGFLDPLRDRLFSLEIWGPHADRLIRTAADDPGWQSLAALDAGTRMVDAIVRAGGLKPGKEAGRVLERFFRRAAESDLRIIPAPYWSVSLPPAEYMEVDQEPHLLMQGAVLIHAEGRRSADETAELADDEIPEPLSPELAAALEEPPARPELEIFRTLGEDGLLNPAVLALALILATCGVTIEAFILRGLLEMGRGLEVMEQRIAALVMILAFFAILFFIELPIASTILRMGRRLETRLRMAFLKKIPRLGDRYFHSRLTSDMTQRAHELRQLRTLPNLGVTFFRIGFQVILTAAGVIWITPDSAGIAVMAALVTVGMSLVTQPILREQDLRLRTLIGTLSRYYLDALLGLVPIRTHSAGQALRREHEGTLVDWANAVLSFYRSDVIILCVESLIDVGFTVWIVVDYILRGGDPAGVLLLLYWTLNLPQLGKSLADTAQQYPMQRNRILRLLEPLGAPEEEGMFDADEQEVSPADSSRGMAIAFNGVSVHAGGHLIISDIHLTIQSGEHVAIVGPSGAGKSSLAGLLLGWHRPASGSILTDGEPLDGRRMQRVRRETAWVDPAVQLWNRSLQENLHYGAGQSASRLQNRVIEQADLLNVLEKLPEGMDTLLGEGGGLVSGGEGQRVRLGRAMLRTGIRLVILDEPFRGLDREKRRGLLTRSRKHWHDQTLIFISHDIKESLAFDRVLVIEEGQVVEDDHPDILSQQVESRYRSLLEHEERLRKGVWSGTEWSRLWLEEGRLERK